MTPETKRYLGIFSAEFIAGMAVQLGVLLVVLTLAWSRVTAAQDRMLEQLERVEKNVEKNTDAHDQRIGSLERGGTTRLVWEARMEATVARIESKVDEVRESVRKSQP